MTEKKRFRMEIIEGASLPFIVDNDSAKKQSNKIISYHTYETDKKNKCLELVELLNTLHEENEQLKKALDELEVYDDEDFREAEYINSIYKEEGFNGVIDYAKRRLCQYGLVKEIEDGLWVMATGGWSDNEFWLDCLNSPVSIFYMKHYCAYETGGAFYYTEKPHDKIEIRLKEDFE